MGSLSRLSSKCKSCPDKEKCDNKKMEMCAYIDEPLLAKNTVSVSISNSMPLMRDTSKVNIGGIYEACKDDIAKEITKAVMNQFSINACGR